MPRRRQSARILAAAVAAAVVAGAAAWPSRAWGHHGPSVFVDSTIDNTGSTLTIDGHWYLYGSARIIGGTVTATPESTLTAVANSGIPEIRGVALDVDLTMDDDIIVGSGSSLLNGHRIILRNPGFAQFNPGLVLDGVLGGNGQIVLAHSSILHSIGSSPGIGSGITVTVPFGEADFQNEGTGAFVNNGTFQVSGSSQKLNLYTSGSTPGIANNGTIAATNGGAMLVQRVANAGVISATGGASIQLGRLDSVYGPGGTWSNTGTITAVDSTLNFSGSSTGMGSISVTGGAVNFIGTYTSAQLESIPYSNAIVSVGRDGVITNTGDTLEISAAMGDLRLDGGRVLGGTITAAPGRKLLMNGQNAGYLDGVTLDAPAAAVNAHLDIYNGLSIAAGRSVSLDRGTIFFLDGQPLTGTGEVVFNGGPGLVANQISTIGSALPTLGSGITIRTGTTGGRVERVNNAGLISARTIGQLIEVNNASNAGTVEAINQGRIRTYALVNTGIVRADGQWSSVELTGGSSNAAGGAIVATNGASLAMGEINGSNPWSNAGTITATDSTLVLVGTTTNFGNISVTNSQALLGGEFTTAQVTSIAHVNSLLTQNGGTINNTGATLDIGPAFPLRFSGGTLKGGTLVSSAGQAVPILGNSSRMLFDGVTINADVNVAPTSALTLSGAWDNNGTISLPGATLVLGGTFTAPQIGNTVRDAGSLVAISGTLNNTGGTFTIDPTGTWRLGPGMISGGTVNSTGGATLQIGGSAITGRLSGGVTLNADAIVPQFGSATVTGGLTLNSTLRLIASASFQGTQTLAGGGEVVFDSTSNSASLRASSGTLTVEPGVTIRSGAGGGTVGDAFASTILNRGLISSRTSGRTINFAGTINNQGTIEARDGGAIGGVGSPAFTNSGVISVAGGSSFTMPGAFTWSSGGSIGGAGSVNLTGAANVTGDVVKSGASAMRVGGALTVAATKKLDLTEGKLILATTPLGTASGGSYSGVQGLVQRGYHFGEWNGDGIVTSMPDAGPMVGITTLATSTGAATGYAGGTFGGMSVSANDVLVMYTYAGDLNLDGIVDAADYGIIDHWIQFPGTSGYANGDINYDGVIDAADYGIIDNTIQLQGAPIPTNAPALLAGVAAVPEPSAGVVLLAAPLASLMRRRRLQR